MLEMIVQLLMYMHKIIFRVIHDLVLLNDFIFYHTYFFKLGKKKTSLQ